MTSFWADAGAPDGHMSRCKTCEKNARRYREEAKASGALEGEPDRSGRMLLTPEERARRSQLARQLHAEGRFGGAVIGRAGGRAVRRHRLTDAVLEHFRQPEEQELVIQTIRKALKGKNKHLGARTAFDLLRMEEKIADRERADRGGAVDPAGMTQEELEEFVAQGLQAMIERGEIAPDVVLGDDAVYEVS